MAQYIAYRNNTPLLTRPAIYELLNIVESENEIGVPDRIEHLEGLKHVGTYQLSARRGVSIYQRYDYSSHTTGTDSVPIAASITVPVPTTLHDTSNNTPHHHNTSTNPTSVNDIPVPSLLESMQGLAAAHAQSGAFVDPYDIAPATASISTASSIATVSMGTLNTPTPVLSVPLLSLQSICLNMQLQIRTDRKAAQALFDNDTLTEVEYKARRWHSTVLANMVQSILQLAEQQAVPATAIHSKDQSNNPSQSHNPAQPTQAHTATHLDSCECYYCKTNGL